MKKFYITILLSFLPLLMFAQGENDNWYFGNYAGVKFTGTAITLLDSQRESGFASGTVSDNSGNLLFYTDGSQIRNRAHQVMENGLGINNGTAWQVSFVKHPTNPKQYYVFTSNFPGGIISYSLIDMSLGPLLNGEPLGKVVDGFKNITLFDDLGGSYSSYGVTVVPHADGKSFWVCFPRDIKMYSYLVNASGLNTYPVVSNMNITPAAGYYNAKVSSSPTISSSFSNYISLNVWAGNSNESKVMSFNNSTGKITNDYLLSIISLTPTTTEFNKDASILYVGTNGSGNIYAIDMLSSSTSLVYNQIYNNPNLECYAIQRNKYNDIYINYRNKDYLSKINNPDVYGGSSVMLNAINLQGRTTTESLPPLLITADNPCPDTYTLTVPETYVDHTYQASNTITTHTNYIVEQDQNIRMKAGNYVLLLPNTQVRYSGTFLATIEDCPSTVRQARKMDQKISLTLDLRKDTKANPLDIYPNPTSDLLYIKSDSKIKGIEIYDVSGKKINVTWNDNKVDVKGIPSGAYIINIQTENGKITKKFIKK